MALCTQIYGNSSQELKGERIQNVHLFGTKTHQLIAYSIMTVRNGVHLAATTSDTLIGILDTLYIYIVNTCKACPIQDNLACHQPIQQAPHQLEHFPCHKIHIGLYVRLWTTVVIY